MVVRARNAFSTQGINQMIFGDFAGTRAFLLRFFLRERKEKYVAIIFCIIVLRYMFLR